MRSVRHIEADSNSVRNAMLFFSIRHRVGLPCFYGRNTRLTPDPSQTNHSHVVGVPSRWWGTPGWWTPLHGYAGFVGTTTPVNQCSFCGRSEDQVKKLIAGAHAFICDECVGLVSKELMVDGPPSSGLSASKDAAKRRSPRRPKA
jgi:hypothetical protein